MTFAEYCGLVMKATWRDLGFIAKLAGIIAVITIFFQLSRLTDWARPFVIQWFYDWSWVIGLVIVMSLVFVRAPYKVWQESERKRRLLQTEKDSRASDVRLEDFDRELQWEVKTGKGLIEVHLGGILRNHSPDNVGSLDYFGLSIETDKGLLPLEAKEPAAGHRFAPRYRHPSDEFIFIGEFSNEYLNVDSWASYIAGAEGTITLEILGQELRSYDVKLADEGKIWNGIEKLPPAQPY